MLNAAKLIAFVATSDAARARSFYQHTLGLRLLSDEQYALVFDSNGTQLRVQKVDQPQPPPYTVLGWQVDDIERTITVLRTRGVTFERFGFLQQDLFDCWTTDDGSKVAWFKDPDGNLLSLTEVG